MSKRYREEHSTSAFGKRKNKVQHTGEEDEEHKVPTWVDDPIERDPNARRTVLLCKPLIREIFKYLPGITLNKETYKDTDTSMEGMSLYFKGTSIARNQLRRNYRNTPEFRRVMYNYIQKYERQGDFNFRRPVWDEDKVYGEVYEKSIDRRQYEHDLAKWKAVAGYRKNTHYDLDTMFRRVCVCANTSELELKELYRHEVPPTSLELAKLIWGVATRIGPRKNEKSLSNWNATPGTFEMYEWLGTVFELNSKTRMQIDLFHLLMSGKGDLANEIKLSPPPVTRRRFRPAEHSDNPIYIRKEYAAPAYYDNPVAERYTPPLFLPFDTQWGTFDSEEDFERQCILCHEIIRDQYIAATGETKYSVYCTRVLRSASYEAQVCVIEAIIIRMILDTYPVIRFAGFFPAKNYPDIDDIRNTVKESVGVALQNWTSEDERLKLQNKTRVILDRSYEETIKPFVLDRLSSLYPIPDPPDGLNDLGFTY